MQQLSTLALILSLSALLLLVKIQTDQSLDQLVSSLNNQVFTTKQEITPIDSQSVELLAPEQPTLLADVVLTTMTTEISNPTPLPTTAPTIKPSSSPKSATPSPTPSPKASSQATPTPLPAGGTINSPAPAVTPNITFSAKPAPPGSLSGDKVFDLTNAYRRSKNLPELQKDQRSCELAASRAPEIMGEVASGTMHKGLADRKLPYWNNENIAYYNTEEETVNWWASDYIHRRQLEGNFKYSCVACYKNACAQELTNFAPK